MIVLYPAAELAEEDQNSSALRVFYGQAQNLLTFTKFTGLDPETNSNMYQAAYPMSRQFSFGLDITF